jgi:hypothetical protein
VSHVGDVEDRDRAVRGGRCADRRDPPQLIAAACSSSAKADSPSATARMGLLNAASVLTSPRPIAIARSPKSRSIRASASDATSGGVASIGSGCVAGAMRCSVEASSSAVSSATVRQSRPTPSLATRPYDWRAD